MPPLLTPTALAERLPDPTLRVFDCTTFLHPVPGSARMRIETGRERYLRDGHVPGAALIDLQQDLSEPDDALRFTLPAPAALVERLRALGIDDTTDVVLYSAGDAWWATRVWWMLRSIGFDRAALLDGGLRRWLAEGRPVAHEPTRHPPGGTLTARPRELFCGRDDVLAALEQGSAVVVNCLRADLHAGTAPYHYGRPGHITGSVNLPAADLFDADGCYRAPDALRALFAARGIVPGRPLIAYCGGGIAATGDAFALTALLGHGEVRVYDNSLQEWAADPRLPMSTDRSAAGGLG